MVRDLGKRLLHEVLAARLAGRFTTDELMLAHAQGDGALRNLLIETKKKPLAELRDRWLSVCTVRNRDDYRRQIDSFISFCGGESKATVADLTTEKVAAWLNGLSDQRRGKAGRPAYSGSKEAVYDRKRRMKKKEGAPPRPVSPATRNRHRTAISAFCTFLVNVAHVLQIHPTRDKRLKAVKEPPGRMPDLDASEWASYCKALETDPLASPSAVLVARILRHTGADVGEVLGYSPRDGGPRVPGMLVRDVHTARKVARIRFKRQKVAESPERLVPVPKRYVADLLMHISSCDLAKSDEVFGMVDRSEFEAAHERARLATEHPKLRLKDFRHLAAIAWARAGVRLERIRDWLGHSDIRQTVIYARFAPDDAFDEPAVERAAQVADGTRPIGVVGAIGPDGTEQKATG